MLLGKLLKYLLDVSWRNFLTISQNSEKHLPVTHGVKVNCKNWHLKYLINFRINFEKLNWTPTALQRGRIEAAEMKLLIPLAGYTLYNHKTNYYTRSELRITGILDRIGEYRRNWLSHLRRMPQNRIPLKSYRYRPRGRRTIGRPKKLWREQL